MQGRSRTMRVDVPPPCRTVDTTMLPVGAISAVEARIAAIRQRMSPVGSPSPAQSSLALDTTPPDPRASGWDPFGEAYQAALEAKATTLATSGGAFGSGTATFSGLNGVESFGATGTGVAGQSVGKIGGFGPMPVPSELQVYGNGRIPDGVLQPVGQGSHVLYAPAAEAYQAAVATAAADGIELRITDSYRTYDQQVDLVERKGLYSQGGYGAEPGTSNHGWGLAVDFDVTDPTTLAWLRNNAYRFGFVEAVPREPWHWEFRPTQA